MYNRYGIDDHNSWGGWVQDYYKLSSHTNKNPTKAKKMDKEKEVVIEVGDQRITITSNSEITIKMEPR